MHDFAHSGTGSSLQSVTLHVAHTYFAYYYEHKCHPTCQLPVDCCCLPAGTGGLSQPLLAPTQPDQVMTVSCRRVSGNCCYVSGVSCIQMPAEHLHSGLLPTELLQSGLLPYGPLGSCSCSCSRPAGTAHMHCPPDGCRTSVTYAHNYAKPALNRRIEQTALGSATK